MVKNVIDFFCKTPYNIFKGEVEVDGEVKGFARQKAEQRGGIKNHQTFAFPTSRARWTAEIKESFFFFCTAKKKDKMKENSVLHTKMQERNGM
jgi:hypothetical protein